MSVELERRRKRETKAKILVISLLTAAALMFVVLGIEITRWL